MKIYLRPIKRAVAGIYLVIHSFLFQSVFQRLLGYVPHLFAAHGIIRPCRKLNVIFKPELFVEKIDKIDNAQYFLLELLRGYEDMRIVLRECAHPEQAGQDAAQLIAMAGAELSQPKRKI